MKPETWWILIIVLVVLAGGSFAFWHIRRNRRRRRPHARRAHSRARASRARFEEDDDDVRYNYQRWQSAPQAAAWYAEQMNGAPGGSTPPNPSRSRYTPDEIQERRRQRRFRPICPESTDARLGPSTARMMDGLRLRAQVRESQVIREHAALLRAWCRHNGISEENRNADGIISDVYFRTTGLAIVTDAVCEVIDNELAYGIVPQRLRVRLYNTYLAAARRTLDEATWRVMYMGVVRKHPAYDDLAQTVRKTDPQNAQGSYNGYGPFVWQPNPASGMHAPFAPMRDVPENDCGENDPSSEEKLRTLLGLEETRFFESDEDVILCIHEDNMEKLRAAVESMEQDEMPAPYRMQYMQLLIDLRKVYCSDFVIDFDKTIDTMPEDVCRQQLKLMADMLRKIRETYTQYPAV